MKKIPSGYDSITQVHAQGDSLSAPMPTASSAEAAASAYSRLFLTNVHHHHHHPPSAAAAAAAAKRPSSAEAMLRIKEAHELMDQRESARERASLSSHPGSESATGSSTVAWRTGRWTMDEKILFLYALRKFGKGRWKKMKTYLPQR